MSYCNDFIPYNYFAPFGPGFRQFPPGPPPFGFPGSGNMFPGPGNKEAPPMGPPPSFTPSKTETKAGINVKAVDPGSIRFCKYKYTYLWLTNGNSFWSDRKSTRLNSSHANISYAVFCLKKKNK